VGEGDLRAEVIENFFGEEETAKLNSHAGKKKSYELPAAPGGTTRLSRTAGEGKKGLWNLKRGCSEKKRGGRAQGTGREKKKRDNLEKTYQELFSRKGKEWNNRRRRKNRFTGGEVPKEKKKK